MPIAMAKSVLLPLRTAVGLVVIVLCQAALAGWVLAAPGGWVPLAGLLPLEVLPQLLCAAAIALAALAAPLLLPERLCSPQRTQRNTEDLAGDRPLCTSV